MPGSEVAQIKRRARVLIIGPSLDILGGQAVQAKRLLDRLRANPLLDVDFLPVNPRLPGPLRLLQSVKYLRTVVTLIAYCLSLLVRVGRYDVLHIFSASYWSFVLAPTPAVLAGKLFRKKTILNYRSGEAEDHLRRWKRTALPAIGCFDEIIVPSRYLVDVFGSFGFSASAIPNFVDLSCFSYRARPSLRPVFLANRNFETLYNVACVIRAFSLIQKQYPEAKLILAGDGYLRAELEQQARGQRNIEFRGRIDPSNMHALYAEADIYLNAPSIDNMPTSILEAFACGLPVVTTNAGGIPYIVENGVNGTLVAIDDHQALAAAALRYLADPEYAFTLATNAYRECEQRYTWAAVHRQWADLYRRLAGLPAC